MGVVGEDAAAALADVRRVARRAARRRQAADAVAAGVGSLSYSSTTVQLSAVEELKLIPAALVEQALAAAAAMEKREQVLFSLSVFPLSPICHTPISPTVTRPFSPYVTPPCFPTYTTIDLFVSGGDRL